MKKFLTLIITFILVCVMSLGVLSAVGCGRDIEPESGNVPVTTPGGDESSGGNEGGSSNGGGSSSNGGGSSSGGSSGGSSDGPSTPPVVGGGGQQQTGVDTSPINMWTCSCGWGNFPSKSICGNPNCGKPRPAN